MTEMGIKHFSHQHKVFPFETLETGEFYIRNMICKACEESISLPFHGCKACQFYIHDECLNTPRRLKHPSHPSHTLVLLPSPTNAGASFRCSACDYSGYAFNLACAECEFDLHPHCANSPATIRLDEHPHELKLMYANPDYHRNTTFNCNVCGIKVFHMDWLYYCSPCGFHVHLDCAISGKQFEWFTTNDYEKHDDSTLHRGSVVHNKQQQQQQQNQSMIDHQAPSQPTSWSAAATSAASATNAANKNLIKEAANAVMEAQAVIVRSQMDQMRMLTKMLDQPLQKILLLAEAINPP